MSLLSAPPPQAPPECRSLNLAGHLQELRRRLGVSLAALLAAVAASFTQVERIVSWLKQPAGQWLPSFAFFTPTEPLAAYIKVAVLAGLVVSMPVILWQLWLFIRSGLTASERSLGAAFIGWGTVLFAAGAAFAYYFLLPAALAVLLAVGRGQLQPVVSIDAYLSFVTALMGGSAAVFELPVVLYVLARLGIVTPQWLAQQRAYAVLVLVIAAAVITPTTDPVSLLLMAAPLVLLYECSIIVARLAFAPRKQRG